VGSSSLLLVPAACRFLLPTTHLLLLAPNRCICCVGCHVRLSIPLLLLSQVKSIAEMGAYVSLLEYNGIEGMILLSELSRRRIRSITKLIKVRACVDTGVSVCACV
jgi:hypothetical protein